MKPRCLATLPVGTTEEVPACRLDRGHSGRHEVNDYFTWTDGWAQAVRAARTQPDPYDELRDVVADTLTSHQIVDCYEHSPYHAVAIVSVVTWCCACDDHQIAVPPVQHVAHAVMNNLARIGALR